MGALNMRAGARVLSPAEQAELTLAMCEKMGYSFGEAVAEMERTLALQRADPEWCEIWDQQRTANARDSTPPKQGTPAALADALADVVGDPGWRRVILPG